MLRAADLAVLRLLRTRGHGPRAERLARLYSRAGEHGALWHAIAALGLLVNPSSRSIYLHAIRSVLAAYVANTALKYLFRRARPVLEQMPSLVPTISGHSYPSAHAAMSFAAARSLSEALPAPPLYAAAAAMSLSRPYLGVHYPSDVLAGAALGAGVAGLTP